MFPNYPVKMAGEGMPLLMIKVTTIRSSPHNLPSTKSGTHNGSNIHIQTSAWTFNL